MSTATETQRRASTVRSLREAFGMALIYAVAIAIAIIVLTPLLWMFSGALKTKDLLLRETRKK